MFADGRDNRSTVSSLIPYFSCSVCSRLQLSSSLRVLCARSRSTKKITDRARQLLSLPGRPVSASLNPVEPR